MSTREQQIKEALSKLDQANSSHWTGDGLPQLGALKIKDIKREDVTAVAPHFMRDSMNLDTPAVAEARVEAAKVEEKKADLNAVRDEKRAALAELEKAAADLKRKQQKASAALDAAETAVAVRDGVRTSQMDIMEHLERTRQHKDPAFKGSK